MKIQSHSHSNLQSSKGNAIGKAIDELTVSPFTLGSDVLDLGMGACYIAGGFPDGFKNAGLGAGIAHLGLGVIDLFRCMDQRDQIHHCLQSCLGHALSGGGHILGALGGGVWAAPLILGGALTSTLEDYHFRNH